MIEYIVICLVALIASLLTFFSGFGLGTLLMPVFAIFFPLEAAIAFTGLVHFANNIVKLLLIGRKASKQVLIRFGIAAVLASFLGAWVLISLSYSSHLYSYTLFSHTFSVSPLNFIVALLMLGFALSEFLPLFRNIQIKRNSLIVGGLLSGFLGGLSGMQGAIRSAFLVKSGLTKESFIATGVVIACFIDITRLSVYASRFSDAQLGDNIPLLLAATLAAIAGAVVGKKLLKKITLKFVQITVAILLILLAVALAMGLI